MFQRRLAEQVEGLPGVEAIASAWREPLGHGNSGSAALRRQDTDSYQRVERNHVSPDYFSLVGIPIVRGRTFTEAELADTSPAVIVTETTARRL